MMRLPFIFFVFTAEVLYSQSSYETLNRDFSTYYDVYFNASQGYHTAVKPYLYSEIGTLADSVAVFNSIPGFPSIIRDTVSKNRERSNIAAFPLMAAVPGYSLGEKKTVMLLEGGLGFQMNLKKKIALNFNFLSGNSTFPNYLDSTIKYWGIVPETGYAYGKESKHSYQYYSGYISYSPNNIFNFQFGKDKNFWGDGYRSLFLSDVANSYPFLKISARVWHFKYIVLYAMHKDISARTGFKSDEKNKFGVFHYLSWNVTSRLNVGIFESIVWQGDDTTRARSFDPNYLNPVIFFRPVEYSLGSSDNAFLGGSFKVKVAKKQQFYGQLIIDEFLLKEILKLRGWWGNKQGVQIGFKSFDLFTIKNLTFQAELNGVRPYTYSHGNVQQNYGHFNQSLAHPLGANFREGLAILTYHYKNFLIEAKGIYAMYGLDTSGINFGQNIYQSYIVHPYEFHNYSGQGLRTFMTNAGLRAAYLLGNTELEAGAMLRSEWNSRYSLNTAMLFIGLRTALWNTYRDY